METIAIINFSNMTVSALETFLETYKAEHSECNNKLAAIDVPTWDTFMQPNIDMHTRFQYKRALLTMANFHPDKTIRDACNDVSTKLSQFQTEEAMRRDVFTVFTKYYDTTDGLNQDQQRYVDKCLQNYQMLGMYLPEKAYDRVKEITKRLSQIGTDYHANLSNCTTTILLTEADVAGLPENWCKARRNADGMYNVSLKYPDYLPILDCCSNRKTRKQLELAFNTRCADTNLPLAEESFALRYELAQLFGYKKYSDYKLQIRMAKTTETVMQFLTSLSAKSAPLIEKDMAILREMAAVDGITDFATYDYKYYARKFEETTCKLDKESLKQHFPLDVVKHGLFDIYQRLLGFTFVNITEENKSTFWHPDVELYNVIETATGAQIGQFYLDLFPREGKYGHAAVWPVIRRTTNCPGVCIMACNFSKTENLSFDFVVTFFHEFGHIMHGMSAETTLESLSGTACERDAVELPSQQLEEWCYVPETLRMMSVGLPDSAIEGLRKSQNIMQGYFIRRQIALSLFDMAVHGEHPTDTVALFNKIAFEQTTLTRSEGDCFPASFAHIMSTYDAGYYGYLWSKVYAVDIFESVFKGHELDNELGMRFRKQLLRWGAVRDTTDSLREFLGRDPSDDAFLRRLLA